MSNNNEQIHDNVRLAFRHVGKSVNVRSMIACILPPKSFCYQSAILVVPVRDGKPMEGSEYLRKITFLAAIFNSLVFDFLIRIRININLTYFMIKQTPIPQDKENLLDQLLLVSARLSAIDNRYRNLAEEFNSTPKSLSPKERIELTAQLNAIVAKMYDVDDKELRLILESFVGFDENSKLFQLSEDITWNDKNIREFNGEVRKRILSYFEKL